MKLDENGNNDFCCVLISMHVWCFVCRPITWITERKRDGKARQRLQEFKFEDGSVLTLAPTGPPPPPTPGHKGLFARDLELFVAEIRGERSHAEITEEKKLVLDGLKLAEDVEKAATG